MFPNPLFAVNFIMLVPTGNEKVFVSHCELVGVNAELSAVVVFNVLLLPIIAVVFPYILTRDEYVVPAFVDDSIINESVEPVYGA